MPNGFIGKPSLRYLKRVEDALLSASAVHSRDPFLSARQSMVRPPSLPARNNHRQPNEPNSAFSGSYITGIGNKTNIVVSDNDYNQVLHQIQSIDSAICDVLINVSQKIEEMCQTIYVVPRTRPRFLSMLSNVRGSLGEFRSLSVSLENNVHGYVSSIRTIG